MDRLAYLSLLNILTFDCFRNLLSNHWEKMNCWHSGENLLICHYQNNKNMNPSFTRFPVWRLVRCCVIIQIFFTDWLRVLLLGIQEWIIPIAHYSWSWRCCIKQTFPKLENVLKNGASEKSIVMRSFFDQNCFMPLLWSRANFLFGVSFLRRQLKGLLQEGCILYIGCLANGLNDCFKLPSFDMQYEWRVLNVSIFNL